MGGCQNYGAFVGRSTIRHLVCRGPKTGRESIENAEAASPSGTTYEVEATAFHVGL